MLQSVPCLVFFLYFCTRLATRANQRDTKVSFDTSFGLFYKECKMFSLNKKTVSLLHSLIWWETENNLSIVVQFLHQDC